VGVGGLRARAAALAWVVAVFQPDADRLRDAEHRPAHPDVLDDEQARVEQLAVRADARLSDVPAAVRHLAADELLPDHSGGARGRRPHRWRQPAPGLLQADPAAGEA